MVYDERVSQGATKKYILVLCRIATDKDEYLMDYLKPGSFTKILLALYSRSDGS
jgi:hypothetical protein